MKEHPEPVEQASTPAPHRSAAVGPAPSWLGRLGRLAPAGIFVLACFYTLYLTADIMVPVTAALLLNLILSPAQRMLTRLRIPHAFGATLIVVMLGVSLASLFYGLSDPIARWMERVPEISERLETRLALIKGSLENVKEASKQVEKITDVENGASDAEKVIVERPGLIRKAFGGFRKFVVGFGLMFVTLFFLLTGGDRFRNNLITVMPRLKDKLRAKRITEQVEKEISGYFLTIIAINAGLGVAIGCGLWFIGLPNAMLWGVMATLLNFIPYLGAFVGVAIVTAVGILTFDSFPQAVLAPTIYATINIFEAQIITPSILGRRLMINPVVVFLTVAFWTWFWGIPGAFMAVPALVIFKVLCDYIEPLHPVGTFLGERRTMRANEPAKPVSASRN